MAFTGNMLRGFSMRHTAASDSRQATEWEVLLALTLSPAPPFIPRLMAQLETRTAALLYCVLFICPHHSFLLSPPHNLLWSGSVQNVIVFNTFLRGSGEKLRLCWIHIQYAHCLYQVVVVWLVCCVQEIAQVVLCCKCHYIDLRIVTLWCLLFTTIFCTNSDASKKSKHSFRHKVAVEEYIIIIRMYTLYKLIRAHQKKTFFDST